MSDKVQEKSNKAKHAAASIDPIDVPTTVAKSEEVESRSSLSAAFAVKDSAFGGGQQETGDPVVYCNPLAAEPPVAERPVQPPVQTATPSYLDYHQQCYKPDRDLEDKVRKACERISENVHICANEPSLALYRLTEHVRKALPPTVESRTQIQHLHQQLQGVYYDAEYGLESVKSMERASPHLRNVQDLLKNSLFLKQQIRHEQQRSLKLHEKHKAAGAYSLKFP